MAEEKNPNNAENSNNSEKKVTQEKAIDVTKPRLKERDGREKLREGYSYGEKMITRSEYEKELLEQSKPKSGGAMPNVVKDIGKSRIQIEREKLERISKSLPASATKPKKDRSNLIKTIVAIILVAIMIILAIVFIVVLGDRKVFEEEEYDVRVSMQFENKSSLTVISESGKEQLRKVDPGDILKVGAQVRNADNIEGDIDIGQTPENVYVRFKLTFELDYEERYDVLIPNVDERLWYRYNAEDERKLLDGVKEDDHYYYFKGVLAYQQSVKLFTEMLVDGNAITCDDGGKYGQIQVYVEVIKADLLRVKAGAVWASAPRSWILTLNNTNSK